MRPQLDKENSLCSQCNETMRGQGVDGHRPRKQNHHRYAAQVYVGRKDLGENSKVSLNTSGQTGLQLRMVLTCSDSPMVSHLSFQ